MIRGIAAEEVTWFLSKGAAFAGHRDPHGFAQRAWPLLRDARRDAEACRVWQPEGAAAPAAGLLLRARSLQADDRTVHLAWTWHEAGRMEGARSFVAHVLERTPHDAAEVPLTTVPRVLHTRFVAWFAPLGFRPVTRLHFTFSLSEVPPLATPLSLESWTPAADASFRSLYREAEGVRAGDARWSWLKRKSGRFRPDLWFVARPAPDRDPVGYAFCGGEHGLTARYRLSAVGAASSYRSDSETVRRLIITVLAELAARSPAGSVEVELPASDPALARILLSVGFHEVHEAPWLERTPD